MRHVTTTIAAIGLLALVPGCNEPTGSPPAPGSGVASEPLPPVDVDVPSMEEAEATAAAEITADNADAVLEALEAELDAEDDDG